MYLTELNVILGTVRGMCSFPYSIDSNGRFVCYKCGTSYKHKSTLAVHVRCECGVERQFKCTMCSRRFKRKTHLRSHVVTRHPH